MQKSDPEIVVEQDFNCDRDTLWQALTDPAIMRQWYFEAIDEFRAEPGFYTQFMVDAGERQFLHQWTVTEVIPGEKLVYRWSYDGYDGKALSVFAVSGDEQSSRLRLSFVVEEDFNASIPEFRRESCVGGWHYFINESLKNYLG